MLLLCFSQLTFNLFCPSFVLNVSSTVSGLAYLLYVLTLSGYYNMFGILIFDTYNICVIA